MTFSSACLQSPASTPGPYATLFRSFTEAGTGAEIDVVTHGGTYGTDPSGASNTFTVSPATLDHFTVTNTSGGAIGTQTAGTSFNVKIRAYDAYNNLEDSGPNVFTGTVDVSSNKTCTSGCVQSAAFTSGVLASHSVTLTEAGTGAEIDVVTHGGTYGTDPSGASNTFTVSPATLDHFTVTNTSGGAIGTQTAGTPFSVKVIARDSFNNTVTGFTGTVDVSSNKTCTSGCAESAAFTSGVLASHSVTLTEAGTGAEIDVVSPAVFCCTDPSGASNTFTVSPATLDHFTVTNT